MKPSGGPSGHGGGGHGGGGRRGGHGVFMPSALLGVLFGSWLHASRHAAAKRRARRRQAAARGRANPLAGLNYGQIMATVGAARIISGIAVGLFFIYYAHANGLF